MEGIFSEFAILLGTAGVMGVLAHLLRQPLIVAYILVGILVGPAGFGWVTIGGEVELLAKTGIALLLFTVGLRLDIDVIRTMGPVSLATGLGQVIFTSVVGFGICIGLGLSPMASLYIAVALTFSSTIIIVKLLSDKREIDSLHGRIAVGFLIVQDLVVVIVMIALTAIGVGEGDTGWLYDVLFVALKGAVLLVALYLLMRFVFPVVFRQIGRSTELMTSLAIAWAVSLAVLTEWLGFSKEVGAFLAGVSLASLPFRDTLGARLISLRDFMLLFFFVDLGAHLQLGELGAQIGPAALLSAFVLIGNPLIVMIILGVMGYRRRTGLLAGLTVAQISEFSLMLAALGRDLGHISIEVVGLITLVGLITITLSTYLILYSHNLYERLAPALYWFERREPYRETELERGGHAIVPFDVVVLGMGRFGSNISRQIAGRDRRVLGVDFDPNLARRKHHGNVSFMYGDADDPELMGTLPLTGVKWVVCTIPQLPVNLTVLKALQEIGYGGRVATTAHSDRDAALLTDSGSDLVLLPFRDAAKEAADVLTRGEGA